tara:strand:- start:208 stop:432 length:225 start_codon:yes stop_codon:yes gene_type:complete
MIWAVKGNGINHYLKIGFNIVRRFKRGNEPDDKMDTFMWFGYSKTLEGAKKLQQKQEVETEIREFKTQQVEKDL